MTTAIDWYTLVACVANAHAERLRREDLAIDAELAERSVGLDKQSQAVQARIDRKEEKR